MGARSFLIFGLTFCISTKYIGFPGVAAEERLESAEPVGVIDLETPESWNFYDEPDFYDYTDTQRTSGRGRTRSVQSDQNVFNYLRPQTSGEHSKLKKSQSYTADQHKPADKHKVAVTQRKQVFMADADRTAVPGIYVVHLRLDSGMSSLTSDDFMNLKVSLGNFLSIPPENVHIDSSQSNQDTLGFYFVKPSASSSSSSNPDDLIPAENVHNMLTSAGLPMSMLDISIQDISVQEEVSKQSYTRAVWSRPYFPYAMATAAVGLVGFVFSMVWCCFRKRPEKSENVRTSTSHSHMPRQISVLYPAAKPTLNNGTAIQPDISHIISTTGSSECDSPLGGSTTPASNCSTPLYSSPKSGTPASGTPLTGCSTPINTPPLRIRKGLLERRGSNASLTIDLSVTSSPERIHKSWGSPPKESSSEEYLQSAGNRMSRKQLRNCLKDVRGLHQEFWEIPMNYPDRIEVAGSGVKNRYRTIIPNESSRVMLPEINGDFLSGYINANYIRGYAGEKRAYIATQGALPSTIGDLWRMVWHEKAPIIVMITKLLEKNRTKCQNYIPETKAIYDSTEVTVDSIFERNGYTLRYITVKYKNEEHKVLHYWYTAWPDHKAPETAKQLLQLVLDVNKQRYIPNTRKVKGPVVVHCSAGIGRTGCFIGTSVGVQQLQEEHMVDILGTVCQMRLDRYRSQRARALFSSFRGGMIQTSEQYEFVHQAVCLYEKMLPEKPPSGE